MCYTTISGMWRVLLVVYLSALIDFGVQSLKCDPLNNVFYHKQLNDCLPCSTCPLGNGKITLKKSQIDIESVYGPSDCIPCRPCEAGYFNDKLDAYNCKKCVNCTMLGLYEVKRCNSTQNATCSSHKPAVMRTGHSIQRVSEDRNGWTIMLVVGVTITIVVVGAILIWKYLNYRRESDAHRMEEGQLQQSDSLRRSHQTESRSQQNSTCENLNYIPTQDSVNYTAFVSDDEDNDVFPNEDNEITPLIQSQKKCAVLKGRVRHNTYPCYNSISTNEESNLYNSITYLQKDSGHLKNPTKSESCPVLSKQIKSSIPDYKTDAETIDFTTRQEPHIILQSFKIDIPECIIYKVKQWDKRYNFSNICRSSGSTDKIYDAQNKFVRDISQKEEDKSKGELSAAFMSKVARYLGPECKFRLVSREAGLSETDLRNIEQDYKGEGVVEQGYQVLQKLKQKELIIYQSDVTNLLTKLDFKDVIDKL